MDQTTPNTDFDDWDESYRRTVESSISFVGQDLDFFAEAKARHLLSVATRGLRDPRDLCALDVGCGVGVTDAHLAPHFRELHGTDTSANALARAREQNPSVTYRKSDAKTLPYGDDAFDLAFAINVLHHVEPSARAAFFEEMHRVTRPGGLIVVFEQNPYNPLTRLAVDRCPFDADAVLVRPKELKELLGRHDLSTVEARYIVYFPWRSRVLSFVESALRAVPLGAQYYVAARKR